MANRYAGTPLSSEWDSVQRRRAVNKALLEQAMNTPGGTEFVRGGRVGPTQAVPYSWGTGAAQLGKALIARMSDKKAKEQEQALSEKYDIGRKGGMEKVAAALTPEPENYVETNPAMKEPDYMAAGMELETNPYLRDTDIGKALVAKAIGGQQGRSSYFRPQYGEKGMISYDARTGLPKHIPYGEIPGGESFRPIQADVDLAGRKSFAEGYGKGKGGGAADVDPNTGKGAVQSDVTAATQGLPTTLTPAQKAVDTKFAEDYANYKAMGGYADVEKGLQQLRSVRDSLINEDFDTGPTKGLIPDAIQSFVTPDALNAKATVQEVAQRNLRAILGGQFAQQEGEQLIARAYDERLQPEKNIERLNRLILTMEMANEAKNEAGKFYEGRGTISGWKGKTPTLTSFEEALRAKPQKKAEGQSGGLSPEEEEELKALEAEFGAQ